MVLVEKLAVPQPQSPLNPIDDSQSSGNSSTHPTTTGEPQKQKPTNTRRRLRELLWMCRPNKNENAGGAAVNQKQEELLNANHDRHRPHDFHHHHHHNENSNVHLSESCNTVLTTKPSVSTIDPATSTRILNAADSMSCCYGASEKGLGEQQQQPSSSHNLTFEAPLQPPSLPIQQPNAYELLKHEYFEELGYMQFECETMAEAQSRALATKRPILAMETRIPGDSDAGKNVFSHPLIVEASRSLFVPVVRVVPQEEDEKERRISMGSGAAFVERSPSGKPCRTKVAFLDPHSGAFLAEPLYGDKLTKACMLSSMVQVLDQWYSRKSSKSTPSSSRVIPKYLTLLCQEETGKVDVASACRMNRAPRPRDYTAYFATEDSAAGEVEFAGLEGVFATRSVFVHGRRGLEVCYDTQKIAYCSLVRHALKQDLASKVFYKTNDEKRAAEVEIARVEHVSPLLEQFNGAVKPHYNTKRALRKTPLRFVPMADIQAAKANRLVHLGRFNEAMHLLSPQQGVILMQSMQRCGQKLFHEVVDVPIMIAWISVSERRYPLSIAAENRESEAGVENEEVKSDDDDEEFECEGGLSSNEFSNRSFTSFTSVQ